MVGVFDSPDGCSAWCSVTLGRLIDMPPPSPPSPSSLRLLLQHSRCYEDGYQPSGLGAADLERMGRDSPLSPPPKMSMFGGVILMAPICHCQNLPKPFLGGDGLSKAEPRSAAFVVDRGAFWN